MCTFILDADIVGNGGGEGRGDFCGGGSWGFWFGGGGSGWVSDDC